MGELAALRTLRDAVRSFLRQASWREVHPGYLAYQCTVEPLARDELRISLAAVESPLSRKPPDIDKHSEWCALHLGGATCNCDWFEKQNRPRCDCDMVSDTLKKLRAEKAAKTVPLYVRDPGGSGMLARIEATETECGHPIAPGAKSCDRGCGGT